MSLTLYRKYRPQTFNEIVGQNHIKATLQSELEGGKVAHAYLFSGPRGLGKTTMARLLAKAVNCLNRKATESEPCNQCDSCREIIENRSIDVIEIDAASNRGIDNVRENIIGNSRFTPTSRRFKVFIIDEVHMLTTEAFNALLKTLEEPPAHAMFILATTEIHKVPETIISRCQHFDFRKVPEQNIVQRLEGIIKKEGKILDQEILENIAYFSGGCLRDAESLLGQVLSLSDKEITKEQAQLVLPRSQFELVVELVEYLMKKDSVGAMVLINKLVQEGLDLEKFVNDLIEILRKILLVKVGNQLAEFATALNKELEKKIIDLSSHLSINFLIRAIEILIRRKQEIKFAEIPQLPLEMAVLEIINEDFTFHGNNENQTANFVSKEKIKELPKPIKNQESAVKTAVSKPQLDKIKISLQQIQEKWQEVLVCLKKYNHSLASTLQIGRPSEVKNDGTLELCFKHKFHQQRINDLKNKQILEKVLQEVFGVQLIVKTAVVKSLPEENKLEIEAIAETNPKQSLDNILESFGGQLVE